MRPDLAKLTTEKERRGHSMLSKKWGGRINPNSDLDSHIGGFYPWSRRRNPNHKEFSDVLTPLIGCLRKNVGRPWDDVYSEFCQFLDRSSVSGYHIYTHLMQEVETNTWVGDDGLVWCHHDFSGPNHVGGYYNRDSFYVDPVSGLLCHFSGRVSRWIRRWSRRDKKDPWMDCVDGSWYTRIRGIWYHYDKVIERYIHTWTTEHLEKVDDEVVIREISHSSERSKTTVNKRQIGGNELKHIRLIWQELEAASKAAKREVKRKIFWKKPDRIESNDTIKVRPDTI